MRSQYEIRMLQLQYLLQHTDWIYTYTNGIHIKLTDVLPLNLKASPSLWWGLTCGTVMYNYA